MTQITILSGVERRRRWSDERKLALVEAAIVPGASVATIARDADIPPSSIYRWRRELCGKLGQPTGFAAVAVHADPPEIGHSPSDMLVIEIRGATIRTAGGVSSSLLVAALRELKA
ncbi:MAG: transposase [Oxalobacteraceae bacterium]|nr:MAG: transposase [Oxalobacteraceae bacterium]